jgi:nuclear migration protein JNM1
MERMRGVLPAVVDRLRGMSRVHADAAGVTSGVRDAQERLDMLEKEVKEWKDALGKVEGGVKESTMQVGVVASRVEDVVKELEGRIEKLE